MTIRFINVLRNLFSNVAVQIIPVIFGFFARSLLIKHLGAEYMGLNGFMVNLLNTLNLAELGFDSVFLYCLYKPYSENDVKTVNAILAMYRKVYFFIGIGILSIGLIISIFLRKFIAGSIPTDINIYLVYYLYLFNTVIGYFLFAYKRCIFKVAQRLDLINVIGFLFLLMVYSVQIYALYHLKNFYLFVMILPICSIFINIAYSIMADKMYPQFKCEGKLEKSFYKDFLKKVYAIVFVKLRTASRSYIDTLVLSAFLGLVVTARYSAYQSLMQMAIIFIIWIPMPALRDVIGNYFAGDNEEGKIQIFYTVTFIIYWIGSWGAICLLCLSQDFITLWVGKEMLEANLTVAVFALFCFIQGIAYVVETIKEITGTQWQNRYCPLVEMGCNIVLDVLLVRTFGVAGMVFATTVCIALITFPSDTYVVFNYYFKKSCFKYLFHLVIYSLITFLVAAISWYVCGFVSHTSAIMSLCLKVLFCIFFPNCLLFIIYFKTSVFNNTLRLVKGSMLAKK